MRGPSLEARRSLAVTEKAILARFTLRAVFEQLLRESCGDSGPPERLFRQLWDTQNPAPGQADLPEGPHCSDRSQTLNGHPYDCRPGEGAQAAPDSPLGLDAYGAVGLFNRFDLAPPDGAHCGEYRIVFARKDPPAGRDPVRNLFNLEAVLPNPWPERGLEGCRPVARFWAALSAEPDMAVRAERLHSFYFQGLQGFAPVLHPTHYGDNPRGWGQVRTNQFLQNPWMLREFKLRYTCSRSRGCVLGFVPASVKANPFGELFKPDSSHPLAPAFQTHFVSQVPSLAINNLNTFNYSVPDAFNSGQSDSQTRTPAPPDDYLARFGDGPSPFHARIQQALNAMNSPLTPRDIVARAQALSCAGCHQRNNNVPVGEGLTWPAAAPFVHSSDRDDPNDASRFQLSPALVTTFLPHRQAVLENYLATPVRDAAFVSQEVPSSVRKNQRFTASVTLRNTGTHAWTRNQGFLLRLLSSDFSSKNERPPALAPDGIIHTGQQSTFRFTLRAPQRRGSYVLQWQMGQEGWGAFSLPTPPVVVTVD